jgi:hypothetical protein
MITARCCKQCRYSLPTQLLPLQRQQLQVQQQPRLKQASSLRLLLLLRWPMVARPALQSLQMAVC